jgi:hypothetical protein
MRSKASFGRTEITVSKTLDEIEPSATARKPTFTFLSRHLVHDSNCLGWGFFFDELDSAFCCGGCNCEGCGAEGP